MIPTTPDPSPAPGRCAPTASRREGRFISGIFFVGCAALLVAASWLHPDARGFGTHEQLGLPPCGFLKLTGIPCPSCGMTTAFAGMGGGHFLDAFRAQPMGAAIYLTTWILLGLSIAGLTDRLDLVRLIDHPNVKWVVVAGVVGFAGGWAWTISRTLGWIP